METAIRYALLFSITAGVTMGSGIWLMTRENWLSLAVGLALGALVFALVYLGRAHGSPDERLADGP